MINCEVLSFVAMSIEVFGFDFLGWRFTAPEIVLGVSASSLRTSGLDILRLDLFASLEIMDFGVTAFEVGVLGSMHLNHSSRFFGVMGFMFIHLGSMGLEFMDLKIGALETVARIT